MIYAHVVHNIILYYIYIVYIILSSSVEKANQFSDFLRTILDKHALPSLRKVITHNSSPWFESIRDELFIAKRVRRQA